MDLDADDVDYYFGWNNNVPDTLQGGDSWSGDVERKFGNYTSFELRSLEEAEDLLYDNKVPCLDFDAQDKRNLGSSLHEPAQSASLIRAIDEATGRLEGQEDAESEGSSA
jgi:hypothetical protein